MPYRKPRARFIGLFWFCRSHQNSTRLAAQTQRGNEFRVGVVAAAAVVSRRRRPAQASPGMGGSSSPIE